MRIAIVEDNETERSRLLGCFHNYEQENNIHFDIVYFKDGLDFINHYNENFDVIYLDI